MKIIKNKNFPIIILALFIILTLNSCSAFKKSEKNEENIVVKKKRQPENIKERILARENAGIFNSTRSKIGSANSYEFATSNVLWRASLETLDFIPLTSVNYSGGIIVTDWYSGRSNSKESIKIEVRFLDNDLKSSSLRVKSFKKICQNNNCQIAKNSEDFSIKIKNNILSKARSLKIEDELKKKK